MTDQDEGYGQDTSQDQNKGGPELPQTPKIVERIKGLFASGELDEEDVYRMCQDMPDSLYGIHSRR